MNLSDSSLKDDTRKDGAEKDTEGKALWDLNDVKEKLRLAYYNNSEIEVLKILKDNAFLFYDLFTRKYAVQPIFRELNFGGNFRCDFAWLNDNSSGPEWVLVEIEKPSLPLFKKDGKPTAELQGAIEQVKTWDQYFSQNHSEKRRIFGAVAKFRFILVAGTADDWNKEHAQKWRIYHHQTSNIQIRSMQTFFDSIEVLEKHPQEFWSFEESPKTLSHSELQSYWENYDYMANWRKILN